jgi:putative thioredoxin
MMDLNLSPAGTGDADLIKDTSEATFMSDVVEASQTVPVIVDFWAPWCGPCKTLGPMLEDAVRAAKGAVKMVKINVDEAQQIAGQLQIQSIPTVYAFFKGQPVDGFQGALPQSEIKAFIDRVIKAGGGAAPGEELSEAVAAADDMLAEGAAQDALDTFAAILGEDPNHAGAYSGMVRAYIALDQLDQAEAHLNGAPIEISKAPELEAAHAQLQLARQAADAGPVLYAHGDTQAAVDQLLTLFGKDREWNDGAAKTQLFTIFEALKPNDPIALNGRRKLSSMIFA